MMVEMGMGANVPPLPPQIPKRDIHPQNDAMDAARVFGSLNGHISCSTDGVPSHAETELHISLWLPQLGAETETTNQKARTTPIKRISEVKLMRRSPAELTQ
jgi:hypothetical protein